MIFNQTFGYFSIKFFLAVFATYRIAFEIAAHFGVMDIFHRMRERAQRLTLDNPDKHFLFVDEMARCATCWSMFISIPIVWFLFQQARFGDLFVIWLAVNGAIVWIHFKLLGE